MTVVMEHSDGPGGSVGWTQQELTKHSPGSQELLQDLWHERAPGRCHHHSVRGPVCRGYRPGLPQTWVQIPLHSHSLPV